MYNLIELVLTAGVFVILATALIGCVCGCKNSNQKSELVGTAGVVKIRFDEEAPSPTPTTPASIKRASTQNSHRSLPEIPHQVGRHDSGDTASEIYATVNLDEENAVVAAAQSKSREPPYEHAYAQLQKENHVSVDITPEQRAVEKDLPIDERDSTQSGAECIVISASVAISGQLPSSQELPYITPPPHADQSHQHFSGDSTDSAKGYTSISVREPLSNIRAQSNMRAPSNRAAPLESQPHYATVSDDSDEMYAAIDDASAGTGSDTYAQIGAAPAPAVPTPAPAPAPAAPAPAPAAHEEPQARGAGAGQDASARRSAPPEINPEVNATHSRQASSSSCSNSISALGSPKPEKRSANSPLPPPPALPSHSHPPPHPAHPSHSHARPPHPREQARISSTGDLHLGSDKLRRSLNEKHQRNNSCVSSSDFYGCNYPVLEQHRFSTGELARAPPAQLAAPRTDQPDTGAGDTWPLSLGPRDLDEMYAKVTKKTRKLEEGQTRRRADDPGYETIDRKKSNHGYETIRKERKTSQTQDPGYETVRDINTGAIYANNNLLSGPNSLLSSDPGYEHISKLDSDSDPNYEVLRNEPPAPPPYATIEPSYRAQPTYSTVNKRSSNNNEEGPCEPNYESMPHEPLYTTGSESDPNYESVRPKDPNYESLRLKDPNYESLRLKDPNYEPLRLKDPKYESVRSKSSKDPNYESVKYFELSKKEPPYEKVFSEGAASSTVERSDSHSSGGYERIDVNRERSDANRERIDVNRERIDVNREPKSSISNGTEGGTVGDYFQV